MQTVTIKDVRDNLAQIIDETAIAKKRFVVTKFGKMKAAIIPIEDVDQPKMRKKVDWTHLAAYGLWKDRKDVKDSARWVRELRERENFDHPNR